MIELQRDRQRIMLERSKANAAKMVIKAPLAGMVALENIWKQGTMGTRARAISFGPVSRC